MPLTGVKFLLSPFPGIFPEEINTFRWFQQQSQGINVPFFTKLSPCKIFNASMAISGEYRSYHCRPILWTPQSERRRTSETKFKFHERISCSLPSAHTSSSCLKHLDLYYSEIWSFEEGTSLLSSVKKKKDLIRMKDEQKSSSKWESNPIYLKHAMAMDHRGQLTDDSSQLLLP